MKSRRLKQELWRSGGEALIVSEATLHSFDLFRKFRGILAWLSPNTHMPVELYRSIPKSALKDRSHEFWRSNEQWVIHWLFDALQAIAPKGFYFGAADGDGACFGWWKLEDEE